MKKVNLKNRQRHTKWFQMGSQTSYVCKPTFEFKKKNKKKKLPKNQQQQTAS